MTYTYSDNRINPLSGAISSRNIEETGTIAELDSLPGIYGIQLRDGIVQGSLTVAENTTGGAEFTQVTTAPLAGQVAVTYSGGVSARGLLIFNAADSGTSVVINYDGYGSVTSKSNLQNLTSGVTAKGSLLTYDTAITELSVGSDGQFLIANSAESKGIEWTDKFQVDPVTGQLSNVYAVDVGTGYPATLGDGWLCRAWVNFNGTGTVSIRAAANVSSITDNGTGDYRVNFTTNLPDTDFCTVASGFDTATDAQRNIISGMNAAVGSVDILCGSTASSTKIDFQQVCVAVYR